MDVTDLAWKPKHTALAVAMIKLYGRRSRMSDLKPGVRNPMTCRHEHLGSPLCPVATDGHTLSPIRARLAAATPSRWRDGVIRTTTSDGWIGIELIGAAGSAEAGATVWVWNHGIAANARSGQPVALHPLYRVLALGRERHSVIIAPEL